MKTARVAPLAAIKYRPSAEFRALKDYRTFEDVAEATFEGILRQLLTQKLGESRHTEYIYEAVMSVKRF